MFRLGSVPFGFRTAIDLMDDLQRRLGYETRLALYESGKPYREDEVPQYLEPEG